MLALTGFSCPSCFGDSATLRFQKEGFDFVECACGVEMFWPIPANLGELYAADNFFSSQGAELAAQWRADPTPWRRNAEQFLRDITAMGIEPGEILVDVGCSYGLGPVEWARAGYDAWGVEISPEATDFIRQNGAKAWTGTVLDDDMPLTGAGVVYSSHALEHMPDPYAALRRFYEMLRPGGVMVLALPHWGGIVAQLTKADWKWCAPPWHLHYFRSDRLPAMIEKIGFEVFAVEATSSPQEAGELAAAMGRQTFSVDETVPIVQALSSARLGEAIIIKARRP